MNAVAIIQLVLSLLGGIVSNLKAGTVTADVQQAIAGVEAAIANLESVQGTPVTYAQLESLRVTPKW